MGQKTVIRDPNSREAGATDADLITTYTYSSDPLGLKTKIDVTRASGDLILWRTYDRRNKLAQTIQQVNAPLHQIPVNYAYDAAGNLISIVDTNGNTLSATYDELGRKLTVTDPDRGKWFFSYDGLGRLRTTTDSKGTVVAAQYDAIGRQQRRFVSSAGGAYRLDAKWDFDVPRVDNGAPQPGTLGRMLGAENGLPLDVTAPAFERDYSYDTHLRPIADTVAIAGITLTTGDKWDPESLAVSLAYDGNYGRLKGTAYPSGEVVALDYDPIIGYPIGESPVIAGGGRDPSHHYRRVTAISSRG